MNEKNEFEIGQLTAEVANLKESVDKLWDFKDGLAEDIKKLEKLVSRGKGFFAGAMFTAAFIGAVVGFVFGKGAKFFGLH